MMTKLNSALDNQPLFLDCAEEAGRITRFIVETLRSLRRRGIVLGVSGGVDSAVCAALAVRAVGPGRVLALLMPEIDVPDAATSRALALCAELGIEHRIEEITGALSGLGCYARRDAAIREVFPGYAEGWRHKIVLGGTEQDRLNHFDLVVETPEGERLRRRMPAAAYMQVVAATNMKQRVRKLLEYHHAEARNFAVLGTPNRLEYQLGFFVRGGDGLADIKPIAHLYKTQVYAMAEYLGISEEIRAQPPSTDTYSLAQTQEEFYFALPYGRMDEVLAAFNAGMPPGAAAERLGMAEDRLRRLYRDLLAKQEVARRGLGEAPLVEPVPLPVPDHDR